MAYSEDLCIKDIMIMVYMLCVYQHFTWPRFDVLSPHDYIFRNRHRENWKKLAVSGEMSNVLFTSVIHDVTGIPVSQATMIRLSDEKRDVVLQ